MKNIIRVLILIMGINLANAEDSYIEAISPDSEKLIIYKDSYPLDSLIIKKTSTNEIIYVFEIKSPYNAFLWINSNQFIWQNNERETFLIDVEASTKTTFSMLDDIFLGSSIIVNDTLIAFSPLDENESILYTFDLSTSAMTEDRFPIGFFTCLNLARYKDREFYANKDGYLYYLNLKNKKVIPILTKKDNFFMFDGPINYLSKYNLLLFSQSNEFISAYCLKNKKLLTINKLEGFIFPFLAPNEEFFYAYNKKNYPTINKFITNDYFFKNCCK